MKKKGFIYFLRQYGLYLGIVLLGFSLFGLSVFWAKRGEMVENNFIPRAGAGGVDSSMELYVKGLGEEEEALQIPVSKREYSDAEIDEVFEQCMDYLQKAVLGENTSLQNITSDLRLVSFVPGQGIGVSWDIDNYNLVDTMGKVQNEELERPVDVNLTVTLEDRNHQGKFLMPIRVMPRPYTDQEKLLRTLTKSIEHLDRSSITQEGFYLPETFQGKKLSYRRKDNTDFNIIWILGILIAFLLFARKRVQAKQKIEKRHRELMNDYPDIVSKLIVFVGAGLSVRVAWEQIVGDYEGEQRREKDKRAAYEEMARSLSKMKNGVHENLVYKEFGRACGLRQYMKLASLLEQNRRTGLSNLRTMLALESQSAWEERVNMARREGEELSTKLLMPLFIMLGIVMFMVIVPAMLTFYV